MHYTHVDFSLLLEGALEDKSILKTYTNWLTSGKLVSSARDYLIRILFITNPQLLNEFRKEKEKDKSYQAAKQKALKAFEEFVSEQTKVYPKKAWQQTLGEVKKLTQDNKRSYHKANG
jgi:hypothetical protein